MCVFHLIGPQGSLDGVLGKKNAGVAVSRSVRSTGNEKKEVLGNRRTSVSALPKKRNFRTKKRFMGPENPFLFEFENSETTSSCMLVTYAQIRSQNFRTPTGKGFPGP